MLKVLIIAKIIVLLLLVVLLLLSLMLCQDYHSEVAVDGYHEKKAHYESY